MASAWFPLAVQVLEKDPLRVADLGEGFKTWVQNAGGWAVAALGFWFLVYLARRKTPAEQPILKYARLFLFTLASALAVYAVSGVLYFTSPPQPPAGPPPLPGQIPPPVPLPPAVDWCLTLAGALGLLGVGTPFVLELMLLRWRRIWALAVLSIKEIVRRRIVLIYLALLLIFLFPPRWFLPPQIADEIRVRTNVEVVYWAMTPLLLLTAGLMAAFSLPTDIRSQTIHTIVTKPVERFEIVLGRFIGYTVLMTAVLAVLTFAGLVFVSRDIPEASLRARVPYYGNLSFVKKDDKREEDWTGEDVGREWGYRKYIAGQSIHRAIWTFDNLPSRLAEGGQVPLEFGFDIFRMTKGEENKGVLVTLRCRTWHLDRANQSKYLNEREAERSKPNRDTDEVIDDRLAEKYGFFEFTGKEVFDYQTLDIKVPGGLFRNALATEKGQRPEFRREYDGKITPGQLQIEVRCDSRTQFLGVAKHDLYFLVGEGYFAANFFKGAVGLWMRLCLVIGVAVACSTYLSGVIGWFCTMFLFTAALFQEFIKTIAAGVNEGGGPAESFVRLVTFTHLAMPLDPTPTGRVALTSDEVFRWFLRRLLNAMPDVSRFDFTKYVAVGFDVPLEQVGLNLLLLAGYLLPWAVLSFYLIKSREIATW